MGDWVTLNAEDIGTLRPSPKLDHHRVGPFKIVDAWGKQSCKLQLTPRYAHLHPFFHVEYLEPYHSRDGQFPEPECEIIDDEIEYTVEKILDKRNYRGKTQYLIHWVGYPDSEDTWEPPEHLQHAQEILEDFNRTHVETPTVVYGNDDNDSNKPL